MVFTYVWQFSCKCKKDVQDEFLIARPTRRGGIDDMTDEEEGGLEDDEGQEDHKEQEKEQEEQDYKKDIFRK